MTWKEHWLVFKLFQSLSSESGTMTLLTSVLWSILPTAAPVCARFVLKEGLDCLSAAGGGRDGAVVQVSGVHNRNGEVENERRGGRGCRWGGGCRGFGSEQRACCGGGFGGARGGEELRLELQQLAHEAEVGGDDAAAPPYKLERFVQTYPLSLHQVGQADGGRAGDACLTVHQHSPTGVPYWIWEDRGERVGKVSKKWKIIF